LAFKGLKCSCFLEVIQGFPCRLDIALLFDQDLPAASLTPCGKNALHSKFLLCFSIKVVHKNQWRLGIILILGR
jgi:hypothetical protein